ncbi:MAG: hypothetical protein E6G83_13425 [Alphaproteobacteria bacterium]|nr:MAG: hypothetical protein E6G83_13425 [Alphaproteobacteria bacterium]
MFVCPTHARERRYATCHARHSRCHPVDRGDFGHSDTPFGAEAEKWLDYYDSDVFDALSMKYALGRIANQRISPMSHTVKLWS